jgi:HEPN domain-containing protein
MVTKTRTHFSHRIDKLDPAGAVLEHLAGAEDFELANAVYRAARKRWPEDGIMLRQEERVIRDSRQETAPETADDQIDRRTPLGYLHYAVSYHAAADLVCSEGIEATHPDAPATFLYCQAAELYLKGFLRLKGDTAARLWWMGHDLQRLASRAAQRGLRLGEAESEVLGWMVATKAWESARYLETGATLRLERSLVREGCSNLKATVREAFRQAGQPIIAPRLKRPFRDLFARWRNGQGAG